MFGGDAARGRPAGRARDGRRRCRPSRAASVARRCRGNCRDGNRRAPACPAIRTTRSRQSGAAGRRRSDRAARRRRPARSPRVRSSTSAIAAVRAGPRQSGSPIARSSSTRPTPRRLQGDQQRHHRREVAAAPPRTGPRPESRRAARGRHRARAIAAPASPARAASTRPSWAKNGGTTFSHAVCPATGMRQTLDRFQLRICTGVPASAMPCAVEHGSRPGKVGRRPARLGIGHAAADAVELAVHGSAGTGFATSAR